MNMNENPLEQNSDEVKKQLIEKEQNDDYAFWMEKHPELAVSIYAEQKEVGPENLEFENLVKDFEQKYPLDELYSITDLTVEEAKNHPLRAPAKLALIPIWEKAKVFRDNAELWAMYTKLSKAVGFIYNGKVDHTR